MSVTFTKEYKEMVQDGRIPNPFKKGDRVRCIIDYRTPNFPQLGEEFVVTYLYGGGIAFISEYPKVLQNRWDLATRSGLMPSWPHCFFELVESND